MCVCVCLCRQEVTPLFSACANDQLEAAQWLIAHGADTQLLDNVSASLRVCEIVRHWLRFHEFCLAVCVL